MSWSKRYQWQIRDGGRSPITAEGKYVNINKITFFEWEGKGIFSKDFVSNIELILTPFRLSYRSLCSLYFSRCISMLG